MTLKPLHNAITFPLITVAILLLGATTCLAGCSDPVKPSAAAAGPLQMLVLGDSIMWGQGLREEEKISSRVKCWLQEKTGREVNIHVEAHSGAIISGGGAKPTFNTTSGEVNLTTPTINEQLDNAIQFYKAEQTSPSLILMNGCINDVGVKSLLAASTTLDDLRAVTRKNCGEEMHSLLELLSDSFQTNRR
jgi:lysophospholipase L1-like esterase